MSDEDVSEGRTVSSVERALDVLLLFSGANGGNLGVSEISRELDLSKGVVHRILTTLRSRQLVHLDDETRRYGLGPASLALGRAYLERVDIRDIAREPLRRLCDRTNETATLSIRTGNSRVYLDQVTPAREVKMTVQIGVAYPLHAGGSSKAFLAFLPEQEQQEYLASPMDALTEHTLVDVSLLRQELGMIRERGFAVSFGERQAGAGSVAAPVLNQEGRPVAVLSVSGPIERIRGHVDELARALLDETRGLSARLGHE